MGEDMKRILKVREMANMVTKQDIDTAIFLKILLVMIPMAKNITKILKVLLVTDTQAMAIGMESIIKIAESTPVTVLRAITITVAKTNMANILRTINMVNL